jgi:D-amino-acid dehydrogenase
VRILIIGGGLVGLCSAYELRKLGHEVTVLERHEAVALETSFANGALLTPSMSDPWNAPGSWRVLLASLGRSDSPLQLRLKAVPGLAGWGIDFLRNSNAARFARSTLSNVRLATYSVNALRALRQAEHLEYGQNPAGTLRLFRHHDAFTSAQAAAAALVAEGVTSRSLAPADVIKLEPALADIERELVGGIHYPGDEFGDAFVFCRGLAERAQDAGVEFRFGQTVTGMDVRNGSVRTVRFGNDSVQADQVVVAAGSYSARLLREAGVNLPVRPGKGYSVTFDRPHGEINLRIAVIDDDLHAALVPLTNSLRAAGTAEFAGFDLALRPERVRNLTGLVSRILPRAKIDLASGRPWCGLRPMSSDGVPIIGRTAVTNLWVSSGHGPLGWTMSVGSGRLLAQLMSDVKPEIDPTPYALARFTPRHTSSRPKSTSATMQHGLK